MDFFGDRGRGCENLRLRWQGEVGVGGSLLWEEEARLGGSYCVAGHDCQMGQCRSGKGRGCLCVSEETAEKQSRSSPRPNRN